MRYYQKVQPTTILEIGTLNGYSAILMADSLSDDGKLITIEIDKNLADEPDKKKHR